ncbi:MAG: helix-turn-helix domain-containing protein [Actinomycetota bacterium]|nr:helix-turn-helix domain-containing protein [Actinomycetota bacterium]
MTITSIDDPRYLKALGHPLRVRILALLEEETSSPVQLSRKLGASLGTVAYHVRTLHELGLLEEVGTTPRRGAVEHHYKALPRPKVSDEAWDNASPVAKQAVTDATLFQILDYCRISAAAGGFDRGEAVLTRTALKLDERGWEELSEAFSTLLVSMTSITAQAAGRLAGGEGAPPPLNAGAVLMLFEAQRFSDQPGGEAPAAPRGSDRADA